jgi:hypothetical protein
MFSRKFSGKIHGWLRGSSSGVHRKFMGSSWGVHREWKRKRRGFEGGFKGKTAPEMLIELDIFYILKQT